MVKETRGNAIRAAPLLAVIVKMGPAVAAYVVVAVVSSPPAADIASAWTQLSPPPLPVAVHVSSTPAEKLAPVAAGLEALKRDASSAKVKRVVVGVLNSVDVWPSLVTPAKLSTTVATYSVAPLDWTSMAETPANEADTTIALSAELVGTGR